MMTTKTALEEQWAPMTDKQREAMRKQYIRTCERLFYAIGQMGIAFEEMEKVDMHGKRCVGSARWRNAANLLCDEAHAAADFMDELDTARNAPKDKV